jgi:hypothetical protein
VARKKRKPVSAATSDAERKALDAAVSKALDAFGSCAEQLKRLEVLLAGYDTTDVRLLLVRASAEIDAARKAEREPKRWQPVTLDDDEDVRPKWKGKERPE